MSTAFHSSNTAEGIAPGTPTRRATLGALREFSDVKEHIGYGNP